MSQTIAFIGLGNMGGGMAVNLLKNGFAVRAFDLSEEALAKAAEAGAVRCASAAEAVTGADAVVTMLPAGKHVEGVYTGDVFDAAKADALFLDCSTIDVATARRVEEAAAKKGFEMVDAPVSGGIAAANGGTLTFMVGGTDQAFGRAKPILSAMGKAVIHAGGAGNGQAAKICNNMLLGVLMIGTSEAIALGVANGLDPKVLSEIMRRSSGGNWALEKYNPLPGVMETAPASKNYAGGFGTDLMLKDLGLAQENAAAVRASTPLGGLARNLYAAHSLAGHGLLDFSSVIKLVQKAG